MEKGKTIITVAATINAPIEKVWACFTTPSHITQWNHANEDWHTTRAENDLRVGGKFLSRMEAKDGTIGFDFNGIYSLVKLHERIEYTIEGGREVSITFTTPNDNKILVTESFEAETENSIELQQLGWQAILDNFKKYVEGV